MAYRFLLEVPEALSGEAHAAIGSAPDTQIVVTRPSFTSGFDQAYQALTIAAHNLRVIDTIYDWYELYTPPRPEVRIVLNTGQRVLLDDHDRGSMIAAIRRDQPWVERTIPKIGEHMEDEGVAEGAVVGAFTDAGLAEKHRHQKRRDVVIESVNYVAIRTTNLAKAERFYTEFFDMEIMGRARMVPQRGYELLPPTYDWDEAIRTDTQADDTYLRNGPLVLTLHRVGMALPIGRDLLDRISIQVDGTTFTKLKGRVLMRSFELISSGETVFVFRDPFGVPWEVTLIGALTELVRTTFEFDV